MVRIPVVLAAADRQTPPFNLALMSIMIPKGLGAAVLATLPAQRGMPGGLAIQPITFAVIVATTLGSTRLFSCWKSAACPGFIDGRFASAGRPATAARAPIDVNQ
ncbi:hypothetical protein MON38_19880 [Hymenobacter sp. DH14]|uniref:Cation/H+ exchanger domain-containing protein n=1 Tax=Hymenobacter cyanobacteriorum TaxID=2926463 RepID=A0A9X1VJA9_9BACT|nr:hypothetical protein [Hymenobacter cyanobacteriorum]MCI1189688.1 hypothetical protein [Hymenobacter cyanobacteriorum]